MADRTVSVDFIARIAGFSSGVQAMKRDVTDLRSQIAQSARTNAADWERLGRTAVVAGAAMSAGLGAAVGTFHGFQREMNRVGALTGATGQQFEALGDLAQELGRTTVYTASQAADALGFLAMAGFDADTAMQALPNTLTLAAAAGMDLAQAADITTNILTGFGMETSELARANDILVATFTNSNTSMQQLGEAMKYAAPLASAAGLGFAEVAAALGMMGNAGIQASMAGTSLRGAITRLLNPTAQVQGVLDRLGVSVQDTSGEMLPLADLLEQLGTAGADAGDLMTIFGQRAGPAMAALLSQGAEELRVFTADLEASGGIAEEIADRQLEGLHGSLIRFRSAAEGAAIWLGEGLAPAIGFVADVGARLLAFVGSLPGPVQTAVAMLSAGTAVVTLLGGAFLLAVPKALALTASLRTITGAATTAAAAKTLLTGAVTGVGKGFVVMLGSLGPVGWTLAGVAAAVGGLVWWLDRMAGEQEAAGDAAATLADSLGLAHEEIAGAAAEAGQSAEQMEQAFAKANAAAIQHLRSLQDETDEADYLMQVGWELIQHGATADEAFAAVEELAAAAGVDIPVTLTVDTIGDVDAQVEVIGRTAERVARQMAASWTSFGSAAKSEITGVAQAAADAFKLGDIEASFRMIGAFEDAIRGSALSTYEQDAAIRRLNQEFLQNTEVLGLSLRNTNDLSDAARELGSEMSSAAEMSRVYAEVFGDVYAATGDADAAMRAAKQAAGEVAPVISDVGDAAGDAAVFVDEFGNELPEMGDAAAAAQGPLEALGYALEDLGRVNQETAERWQDTAGMLLDANEAIARSEDENRAAAEAAAEKHNAAIDKKIEKLKQGSTEQREELTKQKKSWEDFAQDITLEQVTRHLEDVNQEFRDWQTDVQTIAGEVGGDVASRLALMGPEWAPIVSQAVDATADEILRLDQALADNVSLQLAAAKMAVQMEIFEEIVRQGGAATVESIAESTGIAADVVDEIWSSAGLDPLELRIDSDAAFLELDHAERRAAMWDDAGFTAWVDANIDPADRKFYSLNDLAAAYAASNPTAHLFARDHATSVIDRVRNRLRELDGSNAFVNVISRGAQIAGVNSRGGITQHDGGLSGTGPRHSGRLGPNEIPVIAERGEFWVNKHATARHLPLLEAINADRYHTGGRVGGRTSYDLGALFGVTRGASFGGAAEHLRAIERMRELYAQMTREIEDRERAERRAALVTARRTAETGEEWRRAVEQMRDHDRETVLITQRRAYEDRLAAAEANQRIAQNREEFEFERMAAAQQIQWISDRMRAEKAYSDEWMRLARQRQQLLDDQLGRLNRMLEERDSMLDARRGLLESQLSLDQGDDPWDWQATTITDQARQQIARLAAWDQAMADARRRGLSEDALAALGIDGPAALGQLEVLLEATDSQLADLSDAIAARNRALGEQVRRDLAGDLGTIGRDTGREWADAIADGLTSGIPAIEQAARELQAALRVSQQSTGTEAAVKVLFDRYGVGYGRHADGSWEDPATRLAKIVADIESGRRTWTQVEKSIAALPKFHDGGRLPGPEGREQLFVGLGGETIRTSAQEQALQATLAAPQIVVVEKIVERAPERATWVVDGGQLEGAVIDVVRVEQAASLRRVASRVGQRKGAR